MPRSRLAYVIGKPVESEAASRECWRFIGRGPKPPWDCS